LLKPGDLGVDEGKGKYNNYVHPDMNKRIIIMERMK
jgi:hypothetical protein